MDIYFATTNLRKVQSIKRDLEKDNISVIHYPIDLIEPRSSEIQKIAKAKITQAYEVIKKPTIVIDSGFYIPNLNGFPRAYVNFALDTVDLDGILKLVKDKSRDCEFRDCLAYMDETLKEPKFFITTVNGKIADSKRGTIQDYHWSRLTLIFIPEGSNKTLAEMSYEEYLDWRKISRKESSVGKQLFDWLSKKKV